jgi:peptidoglycan-associated lipoprotein
MSKGAIMGIPWQRHDSYRTFSLWLIALTMVFGCTGRRITTAVEDQAFVPGPSPAPVAEAAKVTPPPAAAPEPSRAKPPVEEVRVEEQPLAPSPPPQSVVQPVLPAAAPDLFDVFFDFDQFVIRSDARSLLEANGAALKGPAGHAIMIEGHCDERGTSAYNLVLGERRAQATRQYLQDLGVPSSQIQITSYGKERPSCTEHSESCWQANRRAHFRHP